MTKKRVLALSLKFLKKIFPLIFVFLLVAGCSKDHQKEVQGYIEGKYIYLSSDESGDLEHIYVHRGDPIKTNQAMFVLDPNPQFTQLQRAKYLYTEAQQRLLNLLKGKRSTILKGILARLAQAKASLSLSEINLRRDKKLYVSKAIGRAKLDDAITTYRRDLQRVNEIQANLAEARLGARENLIQAQQAAAGAAQEEIKRLTWALDQKTVRAPVDARVFDTFFRIGEFVPAGRPVLSILAPEYIQVIFFVPEPIVSRLSVGETVNFGCDGCKGLTKAKIRFISPEAEYTPPVIFSREARTKLVFRIEASMKPKTAVKFHPGQPVDVYLNLK